MSARKLLRRVLPARLRLCGKLIARSLRDRRAGIRFARSRGADANYPFRWGAYSRPFIDYPGQEALGAAKRQNQVVLARKLDGLVVAPGEVLSVWKIAGRPSRRAGYADAAALIDARLTTDVGGAICLLSTVLYNVALLSGLQVTERHCHSVDSYGSGRYFELGRDAAIEFGYLDLRFRNPHPVGLRLSVAVSEGEVLARFDCSTGCPFSVALVVSDPELLTRDSEGWSRFSVRTHRSIVIAGHANVEELGNSVHRIPAKLEGLPLKPA